MSIAIIPPRMIPSGMRRFLFARAVSMSESPVLINPIIGLSINIISTATTNIPTSGYISVGLIPSSDLGNLEQIFLRRRTTYPARKPAAIPPRKPDTVFPPPSATNPNFDTNDWKPPRLSPAHT